MCINLITFQRRTDIPDLLVPVQCQQHPQLGRGVKGFKKCLDVRTYQPSGLIIMNPIKKDLEVKLIQVQIEKSIESIGSFVSFDSEMTSN